MTIARDADAHAALPPAATLREIARQLQAMYDVGEFGLCYEHVRSDMATLPACLNDLANEIARFSSCGVPGSE